jgi:integrase
MTVDRARFLTNDKVNRLTASCNTESKRGRRDKAILNLFLYMGLEVGRLVTLTLDCFVRKPTDQGIDVLIHPDSTRLVRVPEQVDRALNTWFEVLDQEEEKTAGWVFVRIQRNDQLINQPLNPQQVRYIVAEYGHKAGLTPRKGNRRLTPTDLRRTCGRNAYQNGARLLDVQALLGQSRPLSTARFIDILKYQNPNSAVDLVQYQPPSDEK